MKRRNFFFIVLLIVLLSKLTGCSRTPAADLVLLHGKIATVDEHFSITQAAAVKNGRILFTGSSSEAERYISERTRVIDLQNKLVLPGLIDAHGHLHSLGRQLSYLDIRSAGSFEEIISIVADHAETAAPGTWIIGGRWDHTSWPQAAFPVHDALSAVSPYNPVYLTRVDGNSALVNQMALDIALIDKDTPDPEGGKIIRKWNHEPAGVLINQAMNLVKTHIPAPARNEIESEFLKAVESCVSLGLTGVHEAGIGPAEISLYKRLIDEGRLKMRVYAMLGEQESPKFQTDDLVSFFKEQRLDNYGGHLLSVRSIKLFFDGALGSRGAAFFADYQDDPGNNGLLRISPDYITKVSLAALEAGMGVNTHCIGIRGNRLCLDAYENALKRFPDRDHRFRIEHAQIVRPEDVAKFAALNVIPSMQPTHCTSDMNFVEERVGPQRVKGGYAWRWFLDAGLPVPCGSDFPVESHDPLHGIYAAVTRQDLKGDPPGGWFPAQRMTIEEAIRGYTIQAAHAAFQEDILGSIETGKLADFTILDKDILTCRPEDIPAARVTHTIVGGEIVYQAEETE